MKKDEGEGMSIDDFVSNYEAMFESQKDVINEVKNEVKSAIDVANDISKQTMEMAKSTIVETKQEIKDAIEISEKAIEEIGDIVSGSLFETINNSLKELGEKQLTKEEFEEIALQELEYLEQKDEKKEKEFQNFIKKQGDGFASVLNKSYDFFQKDVLQKINSVETVKEEDALEMSIANNANSEISKVLFELNTTLKSFVDLLDEARSEQEKEKKSPKTFLSSQSSGFGFADIVRIGTYLAGTYAFKDEIGGAIGSGLQKGMESVKEWWDPTYKSTETLAKEINKFNTSDANGKRYETLLNLEEQRLVDSVKNQSFFEKMNDSLKGILVKGYKTQEELLEEFKTQRKEEREKEEKGNGILTGIAAWKEFGNTLMGDLKTQMIGFANRTGQELSSTISNPLGFQNTSEGQNFVSSYVPNNGVISINPTNDSENVVASNDNTTSNLDVNFTGTQSTLQGVKPEILAGAERLGEDLGVSKMTISSGFRSAAQQAGLRKSLKGQTVAKGRSMHELGQAIDLPYSWIKSIGKSPNEVASLARKQGFYALLEPKNNALHLSMGGENHSKTPLRMPKVPLKSNATLNIPQVAQNSQDNQSSQIQESDGVITSAITESNGNTQNNQQQVINNTTIVNNPQSIFDRQFNV